MAKIPLYNQQVQAGVVSQPRMSGESAAAPWRAVAQAGQAVSQVGGMMGDIQKKKKILAEKEQAQNDSLQASNYKRSLAAQKEHIQNFKLKESEAGRRVTPDKIAEINAQYAEERQSYLGQMSDEIKPNYTEQFNFDEGIISKSTENFFLSQRIETRNEEFQSNYTDLLKAGDFDSANELLASADWMLDSEKIDLENQALSAIHTSDVKSQYEYSVDVRTKYDNGEVHWQAAHDALIAKNEEIEKSKEYTQDERLKISQRNTNAANGIRKQAETQANSIISVAFTEAKSGNSIQGILDEQGAFIESVYPKRLQALESFENSKTMLDIQEDAAKKKEATDTAMWRLNTDRADLAERVAKQTGFWRTKFFDKDAIEDTDKLVNDILTSDVPKEDKALLSEFLIKKSENRVSGTSGGMVQGKKVSEGYAKLTEAYSIASAESGNANYWSTFFDDFTEIDEYAKEHSPKEVQIFVDDKVQGITDKANADLQQAILGAKVRGEIIAPTQPDTVRMVTPDGRPLLVPADRVYEMEEKGATRQ